MARPLDALPEALKGWSVELSGDGNEMVFNFNSASEHADIAALLRRLGELGINFKDLHTRKVLASRTSSST